MSARTRLLVFLVGAAGVGALLVAGYGGLPHFGTARHPYGNLAVHVAVVLQKTANTVASVTFDQRGFDTMGEEFILFASVLGAGVLLRPGSDEREDEDAQNDDEGDPGRKTPPVLDAVRFTGYLLLPVTIVVGLYVVIHGHLSPGGGFQGGVVLGTGLHLLYLAGDYRSLERLRPRQVFEVTDAVGAGGYIVIGLAALVVGGAFLANVLPQGSFSMLASGGTVPLLNIVVGLEVGSGIVLLLAEFLEQALVIRERE